MFSLLLAVIYLAFVSLGLPDSLLGSAWPVMHVDLCAGVSDAGLVTMVISVCTITASLLSDKLAHKMGTGLVTAFSVLLTAVAMLLFSFAIEFWHLIVFAIPYGLGAGAIDSVLNNYVALHLKAKHMSWLHCFWGIGATLSPYIMGFALSGANSWHGGYRFVSYVQFGLAFVMFLAVPLWKKIANNESESRNNSGETDQTEETISLSIKEVFKLPCALALFIAFFFYCAIEQLPFVYASSYFVDVFSINEETAAFLASLFYIGMTISRAASGFLTAKLNDKQLVRIGLLIVFFSAFLIVIPLETPICAIVGFLLIGIGCGPVYPSIMHATPDIFGRKVSGSVIGVQMAFAYTSSTLMPLCFGKLSDVMGLWILPLCIILFSVIVFWLTERINKYQSNKKALE